MPNASDPATAATPPSPERPSLRRTVRTAAGHHSLAKSAVQSKPQDRRSPTRGVRDPTGVQQADGPIEIRHAPFRSSVRTFPRPFSRTGCSSQRISHPVVRPPQIWHKSKERSIPMNNLPHYRTESSRPAHGSIGAPTSSSVASSLKNTGRSPSLQQAIATPGWRIQSL